MLTLVLGRAGSGKTASIMEKIKNSAGNGRSILIVPEQYSHDAERHLSMVCGDAVSLYAEVLSFSRLCSRVFSETGRGSVKLLDPGGRLLVMNRALSSLSQTLKIYNVGQHRAEFVEGLICAYDEFMMSCVPQEMLFSAAEMTDGSFSDKLRDLALIFDMYEALRPKGLRDPREALSLLAEDIEKSSTVISSHIYIDGFSDFTTQEMSVVEKLININADVTVCLTCGDLNGSETVFEAARETANKLIRTAFEAKAETQIINMSSDAKNRAAELKHLDDTLFSDKSVGFGADCKAIELFKAENVLQECELAAARTVQLVRDEGYRYRDISVVARGWEEYDSAAESVFAKYGVPVTVAGKSDILQKPVLALITSALEIVTNDWEYSAVFRYLKTNLAGIDLDDRDVLENYVLKWNIRGASMWSRDGSWTFNPMGFSGEKDEKTRELINRINTIRKAVSKPLIRFQKAIKAAETAREKVTALYSFLEDISLPARLEEKAEELGKRGEFRLRDEYVQLWEILVKALEQCCAILGDERLDSDEFSLLFRLLLSQYEIGTIPVSLDRVGLGDMSRMRRRDVKCLIVLGATDASLPKYSSVPGVLSDDERDELSQLGIQLRDTSEGRLTREMNIIYSSLSLPADKLIVTYPADGEGGGRPSFVVTGIKNIFSLYEKPVTSQFKTEALSPCFELAVMANSLENDAYAKAAEEYFNSSEVWKKRISEIRKAAEAPRGALSAAAAERLYSKRLNVTASRVDKYYSCRFSYFIQYGLRAKPRKPAGFDAPEAGTFMHYILENTAAEATKLGGFALLDREKCKLIASKYVSKYIEETLDSFQDKSSRFVYLFNRLVKDVYEIVFDMADELARSSFTPLDFELDFSNGGDMPPAVLEGEDVSVSVSGKVDRVDGWVHDNKLYLRVVDYKTGKKAFRLSDVLNGMGIQMLIYLFVLQKSGKQRYGKEIVPAGVLYVPARQRILPAPRGAGEEALEKLRSKELVRSGLLLNEQAALEAMEHGDAPKYIPVKFKSGEPSGDSLAALEQLGKLSRHVDKMLLAMGKEMQNGLISADPYYKSQLENACNYCDYFEACHFDEDGGADKRRWLPNQKPQSVWEKIEGEEADER